MKDTFSYSLTPDDYLSANREHFLAALKRRKLLYYPVFIFAAYSLLALIAPKLDVLNFGASITGAIFAGSALLALYLGTTYLLMGSTTVKMYRQNKLIQFETSIKILPAAIEISTSQSASMIAYGLLFRWAENAEVMLLYPAEGMFFILPRRAMMDDQYRAIRSGLLQHLQQGVAAKVTVE